MNDEEPTAQLIIDVRHLDELISCVERIEDQLPTNAHFAQMIDIAGLEAREIGQLNAVIQDTAARLGPHVPRISIALEGVLNQLARIGDSLEQLNAILANNSGTTQNGRGYLRTADIGRLGASTTPVPAPVKKAGY